MKVAIPIFGKNVAPRFGFVDQFLIATVSEDEVRHTETVFVGDEPCWNTSLEKLKELHVEVILCGGFNRRFEPFARSLGIEVIAGLTGEAVKLAHSYAKGETLERLCSGRAQNRRNRKFRKRRGKRWRLEQEDETDNDEI